MEPERVVGQETCDKWARYRRAYEAKSRWIAEERDAKAALLADMGYKSDEDKPAGSRALDGAGEPVFEIKVTHRRGLDAKYLREKYPEIYAECERWTHPISIRPAE